MQNETLQVVTQGISKHHTTQAMREPIGKMRGETCISFHVHRQVYPHLACKCGPIVTWIHVMSMLKMWEKWEDESGLRKRGKAG